MKKALLVLALMFIFSVSTSLIAQIPDLEGTYYFYNFPVDLDVGEPLTVDDAPQNPYIIINPDLSFTGLAACNTFSGQFIYTGDENYYQIENFDKTENYCNNINYSNFENYFFSEFETFENNLLRISGGQDYLYLEEAPGFGLEFQDIPVFNEPPVNNTWYLHHLYDSPTGIINVADIAPAISPLITIQPNFSFEGTGACNTFLGNFIVDINNPEFFIAETFNATTNSCTTQEQTDFENYYFNLIQTTSFEYSTVGTSNGDRALNVRFNETSMLNFKGAAILSIPENALSQIKIYPNPVSDILNISVTENYEIDNVSIYTITGQMVLAASKTDRINVARLQNGIYFLTVKDINYRKIVRKFIKKQLL